MRRAAKVDMNQSSIVQSLLQAGCSVQTLAAVGIGCPDILVGLKGKNYLLEIKNPDNKSNTGKLNREQKTWHKCWDGQVAVVHNAAEAFAVVGI